MGGSWGIGSGPENHILAGPLDFVQRAGMVSAKDIADEESLHAWLEAQPRQIQMYVLQRAIMRFAPVNLAYPVTSANGQDITSLSVLRTCLLLMISANGAEISPEMNATSCVVGMEAAAGAFSGGYGLIELPKMGSINGRALSAAARLVTVLTLHKEPIFRQQMQSAFNFIGSAAAENNWEAYFNELTQDAKSVEASDVPAPLFAEPNEGRNSGWRNYFERNLAVARKRWSHVRGDWPFWVDLFEASLSGNAPDWALLEKVALIPDVIWQQGAEAVNARIAEMRIDTVIKATPNSEEITVGADGLFHAVPLTTIRPQLFSDAKGKVQDTVTEIRRKAQVNPNLFGALHSDLDRLDDYHARYCDNPQRIHDVYEKTTRHVEELLHSSELSPDQLISDLLEELDAGTIDIRRSDTEVAKTVKARAGTRFRRLSKERREAIAAGLEGGAAESVPQLARELREDAAAVREEGGETEADDDVKYRATSRGSRMGKLKEKAVKTADDAFKLGRAGEMAGDAANAAPGWWQTLLENLPDWLF